MSISTWRTAALLLAGIGGLTIAARSTSAGDRIYPCTRGAYADPCDDPGCTCGTALCRKFKLHCVYCRRACSQRYITLPYTQPDSTIYIPPAMYGGQGAACPQPAPLGAMGAAPVQYGYGMSPAFAPPGSIFIR